MDLHELRVAARLIDELAKRALFAEKQMVALEGQCAEWQRIADDLKAERNAYRDRIVTKIHTIKLERDALRAACDRLAKSFDEQRARIRELVNHNQRLTAELAANKDERDTLRKERDGLLTQVQDMRARINALTEELCKERNEHTETADLLNQANARVREVVKKTARKHPTNEGGWVQNRYGATAQVAHVVERPDRGMWEYQVVIGSRREWWFSQYCTPCDPPEASHDTPEGKAAAEAVKREPQSDGIRAGDKVEVFQKTTNETLFDDISICGTVSEVFRSGTGTKCVRLIPNTMNRKSLGGATFGYDDVRKIAQKTTQAVKPKPGDTVRLVRKPTQEDYPNKPWSDLWGQVGQTDTVMTVFPGGVMVSSLWSWPISCIEIVEDAK